jgi:hypothetical protein
LELAWNRWLATPSGNADHHAASTQIFSTRRHLRPSIESRQCDETWPEWSDILERS